ncbi:hypothetical protein ACKKBF_B01555 [Auxenochlorella protothecoides x Auxenochlorella symbiontica]
MGYRDRSLSPGRRRRSRSREARRRSRSPPPGDRSRSRDRRRHRDSPDKRRPSRSPVRRQWQEGSRSPDRAGGSREGRWGPHPSQPRDRRRRDDADIAGSSHQSGSFAPRGACHRCGEEGHWARECPSAPPGGARGRGRREGGEGDGNGMSWGRPGEIQEELPDKEVKPDFGLSGALAAETNTVNGVVLLYQEPPEASMPTQQWRLYTFKSGEPHGKPLFLHRQSSYLFGRDRTVVDIPTDHPSCSKQHCVLQYRRTEKEGADGMMVAAVRPYLMDLGSTNGTFLNGERLDDKRFYELLEQDMIRTGNSSREYVLLHDKSGGR